MVAGDLNPRLFTRISLSSRTTKCRNDSPEVDVLSVGDTTLDSSRPVGGGAETSTLTLDEGVVVARPGNLAALEARADFEALGGGDGEHGVRELSLELVEDGLTESSGDIADDADDGTADRVLSLLGADDALYACG